MSQEEWTITHSEVSAPDLKAKLVAALTAHNKLHTEKTMAALYRIKKKCVWLMTWGEWEAFWQDAKATADNA